ncbi:flavocytochrome c [Suicoccus acidiformans]|uniref:Urocanate reductase n=1 Tax=Suicoccus acidiformans TaxID=2036206 RepID=A0A347WIT3_9LACT|nr:FAD-dependent oxidoreductase [Suicoccus acidiformans]AXY24990.1 flavocytochrome c [Suicoccus acidiformans]
MRFRRVCTWLMSFALVFGLLWSYIRVNATDDLFVPGSYEEIVEGHNGPIEVEVEVTKNEIVGINISNHQETQEIAGKAIANIPQDIMANTTINVDAISGATVTSEAIILAVKNALLAAGANELAITKPIDNLESNNQEKIEKTVDAVVIGSGGAGMSAGAEISEAGYSVLVLEKMPIIGGNTIVAASAMNAADPERQHQQEMNPNLIETIEKLIELEPQHELMEEWQKEIAEDLKEYNINGETYLYDSPALHKLQTYVDGDYVGDPELINVFGDKALESIHWLEEHGAKFVDSITSAVGATWERSHTPTQDLGSAGASFVLPQQEIIESNGGEILLEHKAEEFILDGDSERVIGVKGTTSEGTLFEIYGEKGVVLATGGFAANPEMREKYNTFWAEAGESVETTNPVSSQGDGIVMAEKIDAGLTGMEWIQMVTWSDQAITAAIENTIQVNQDGERFVREDGRRDEICQAILEQDGGYMYRIYDATTIEDELDGISYKGVPITEYVGKGAYMNDTLEGLAEDMGVPFEALQKTINEYNGYVENGGDPLGRTLFGAKIERGPFYAVKYAPRFHHTMGGVMINSRAQALDTEGEVIPGLYAAGEVTGGIHGSNRLGGNAITDIITFGRIAGQSLVEDGSGN